MSDLNEIEITRFIIVTREEMRFGTNYFILMFCSFKTLFFLYSLKFIHFNFDTIFLFKPYFYLNFNQ